MEGLFKEDIGSKDECLGPISGSTRGGQDHDWHGGTGRDGRQMAQEFRAMALRQGEIEQEHIGPPVADGQFVAVR